MVADFGCGTGLEGEELRKAGFKKIIGLDCSQEMLNNVPEGVYDEKLKFFLGKDPVPESLKEKCDLVTASGVLVSSHVPPSFIEEMLTLMKKGAYFVFNGRDTIYNKDGYKEALEKLVADGKYALVKEHNYQRGVASVDINQANKDLLSQQSATIFILQKL